MVDEGEIEIKLGLFNGFLEFKFKNHADFIKELNRFSVIHFHFLSLHFQKFDLVSRRFLDEVLNLILIFCCFKKIFLK